jgi:hypothetical protein
MAFPSVGVELPAVCVIIDYKFIFKNDAEKRPGYAGKRNA